MSILNKKTLVIIVAISCAIVVAIVYKDLQGNDVYIRTVTEEEGLLLSESMQIWLEEHRKEPIVSAYSYKNDGVYELLLVDNRNDSKNLYLTTEVSAKQRGNTLLIEYSDTDAQSESGIKYNQETYLILKNEPSQITLKINGAEQTLLPEIGETPITLP